MKKVTILFEQEGSKVGYVIDAEKLYCISGKFDEQGKNIIEVSQEGTISNKKELCQQITWVLSATLNENG